ELALMPRIYARAHEERSSARTRRDQRPGGRRLRLGDADHVRALDRRRRTDSRGTIDRYSARVVERVALVCGPGRCGGVDPRCALGLWLRSSNHDGLEIRRPVTDVRKPRAGALCGLLVARR